MESTEQSAGKCLINGCLLLPLLELRSSDPELPTPHLPYIILRGLLFYS